MIASALLSSLLISHVRVARAIEPIPFEQKLLRQSQRRRDFAHAWRAGERIRAPFFSHCEEALTLTVAPRSAGGLRSDKHSDHFIIEDSAAHLAKIHDWRGMTYGGVLEVIAPVDENSVSSNVQTYRARVISLDPPVAPINPGVDAMARLKAGDAVVIVGRVIEIFDRYVKIRAPRGHGYITYDVLLRSGVPVLEGDLSDTIKTLGGTQRLEVGDYVHLNAHATGGVDRAGVPNHLWAESRRTCYLEAPGRHRVFNYRRARRIIRALMRSLVKATRREDWPVARMIDAALQSHRLTPVEAARLDDLRLGIPDRHRALVLTHVDPATVDLVDETFNISLAEMTRETLYDFAYRWSQMKIPIVPNADRDLREQTILFELLARLEAPGAWTINIAKAAVRQRLSYFELRSHVGHGPSDADWREMINLGESLRFLGENATAESVNFVISECVQLAHLEAADWTYRGRFTRPAFEALSQQVRFARENSSPEARRVRRIFTERARELRGARGDLQGAPGPDGRSRRPLELLRRVVDLTTAW